MIDRESGRNKERKRILQIRHPPLGEQSQRQTALYHSRSRNDRTQSSRSSIRQKNDRVLLFISTRFRGNKFAISGNGLRNSGGASGAYSWIAKQTAWLLAGSRKGRQPCSYGARAIRIPCTVYERRRRASARLIIHSSHRFGIGHPRGLLLFVRIVIMGISKSVYRFHCFEQLYFTPTISTIVVAKFRNFVKERKEGRVFDGKIKSSIADWFTFGRRVSPTSKFARAIYWQFFKSN